MIYSVFQDDRYGLIGCIAVAVVLVIAMLSIIISFILRSVRKKEHIARIIPEIVVRSVGVMIILLVLCLRIIPDISYMATVREEYKDQTCNILVGETHDINIEYYGGRDESYSASFIVDDVIFEDAMLTEKKKAETIKKTRR